MSENITMLSSKTEVTTIAQISDCHLFADVNGLHHDANVYQNLLTVLLNISHQRAIAGIVFTGDLTQDHSEASYQNFVKAIHSAKITIPVYYLAGNHDEIDLLNKYLYGVPFNASKTININQWQIQLLHSKSETPAGFVEPESIRQLHHVIEPRKKQLLMMHHHPVDVGYFIDKHGLLNKTDFWAEIKNISNVAAIACGHVHRGSKISAENSLKTNEQCVDVYTCPATSIQFDPKAAKVAALNKEFGYRLFNLAENGTLTSDIIWC